MTRAFVSLLLLQRIRMQAVQAFISGEMCPEADSNVNREVKESFDDGFVLGSTKVAAR